MGLFFYHVCDDDSPLYMTINGKMLIVSPIKDHETQ
jgi:hypothetical protein